MPAHPTDLTYPTYPTYPPYPTYPTHLTDPPYLPIFLTASTMWRAEIP